MPTLSSPVLRILLVEGDVAHAELLATWSRRRSGRFDVDLTHVSDLHDARLMLADQAFQAIALNLDLPDTPADDPISALRGLRSVPNCPPVVVMTDQAAEVSVDATLFGAEDVLSRPTTPEGLEALLRSLHQASIREALHAERDDLLRQLTAHNTRLERLAKVMAHDLRTPIAVAQGAVETAATLMDAGRATSARTQLDLAFRRLRMMGAQMEAVLDETILGTTASFSVSVSETAELAYASLSTEQRGRLHLVTVDGPRVAALPGTLRQILQNLLSNATQHNADTVTVTIAVHEEDDNVVVTIDDDGIGWRDEPEVLATDGVSTAGSTGLGLSTVRLAAESMGAAVTFGSSPTGGTRVTLHMPVRATGTAPQPVGHRAAGA